MMKKLICDLHVHTHYSIDSEVSMESYCVRALEGGVDCVCFTDHIDFNPADDGYGYYDADGYFSEFERARDRYAGRLHLLSGVEFSGPHKNPAEFERLCRLPYDFIIGSVHYWHGDLFPSEMVRAGIPVETCYEEYWKEVLAAVSHGGFDCLGHMDFPKRYYGEMLFEPSQIREIFDTMVKNGICPEINTSSLRKGLTETMPGKGFLELYKAAGGKSATVGSDAHTAEDLAAGREQAERLIGASGLREVLFENRKMRNATCG